MAVGRYSNFMQLLYFCEKYVPELVGWLKKPQDRFTSPEIKLLKLWL